MPGSVNQISAEDASKMAPPKELKGARDDKSEDTVRNKAQSKKGDAHLGATGAEVKDQSVQPGHGLKTKSRDGPVTEEILEQSEAPENITEEIIKQKAPKRQAGVQSVSEEELDGSPERMQRHKNNVTEEVLDEGEAKSRADQPHTTAEARVNDELITEEVLEEGESRHRSVSSRQKSIKSPEKVRRRSGKSLPDDSLPTKTAKSSSGIASRERSRSVSQKDLPSIGLHAMRFVTDLNAPSEDEQDTRKTSRRRRTKKKKNYKSSSESDASSSEQHSTPTSRPKQHSQRKRAARDTNAQSGSDLDEEDSDESGSEYSSSSSEPRPPPPRLKPRKRPSSNGVVRRSLGKRPRVLISQKQISPRKSEGTQKNASSAGLVETMRSATAAAVMGRDDATIPEALQWLEGMIRARRRRGRPSKSAVRERERLGRQRDQLRRELRVIEEQRGDRRRTRKPGDRKVHAQTAEKDDSSSSSSCSESENDSTPEPSPIKSARETDSQVNTVKGVDHSATKSVEQGIGKDELKSVDATRDSSAVKESTKSKLGHHKDEAKDADETDKSKGSHDKDAKEKDSDGSNLARGSEEPTAGKEKDVAKVAAVAANEDEMDDDDDVVMVVSPTPTVRASGVAVKKPGNSSFSRFKGRKSPSPNMKLEDPASGLDANVDLNANSSKAAAGMPEKSATGSDEEGKADIVGEVENGGERGHVRDSVQNSESRPLQRRTWAVKHPRKPAVRRTVDDPTGEKKGELSGPDGGSTVREDRRDRKRRERTASFAKLQKGEPNKKRRRGDAEGGGMLVSKEMKDARTCDESLSMHRMLEEKDKLIVGLREEMGDMQDKLDRALKRVGELENGQAGKESVKRIGELERELAEKERMIGERDDEVREKGAATKGFLAQIKCLEAELASKGGKRGSSSDGSGGQVESALLRIAELDRVAMERQAEVERLREEMKRGHGGNEAERRKQATKVAGLEAGLAEKERQVERLQGLLRERDGSSEEQLRANLACIAELEIALGEKTRLLEMSGGGHVGGAEGEIVGRDVLRIAELEGLVEERGKMVERLKEQIRTHATVLKGAVKANRKLQQKLYAVNRGVG